MSTEYEGCACGHKLAFCHKGNAATYCGSPVPTEVYRAALMACAEIAGDDVSGGIPTWPAVEVWAVEQVRQLRKDYDELNDLRTTNAERSSPESESFGGSSS